MTLAQARASIGHAVIYRAPSGRAGSGVISAVAQTWVIVQYRGCEVGKCTAPELLELTNPGSDPRPDVHQRPECVQAQR